RQNPARPADQEDLSEHGEVLATVQFPYPLVIAHLGEIQIRNAPEVFEATGLARAIVAAPVDFQPCLDNFAEYREAMRPDFAGEDNNLVFKQCATQQSGGLNGIWKSGPGLQ